MLQFIIEFMAQYRGTLTPTIQQSVYLMANCLLFLRFILCILHITIVVSAYIGQKCDSFTTFQESRNKTGFSSNMLSTVIL